MPALFRWFGFTESVAAVRARIGAWSKPAHAAYFLGAMAHYIGDVSQYGHDYPDEVHHGDYESWAATLTSQFNAGTFESAITLDSLVRRTPFNATKRVPHSGAAARFWLVPRRS